MMIFFLYINARLKTTISLAAEKSSVPANAVGGHAQMPFSNTTTTPSPTSAVIRQVVVEEKEKK
jgi:hypothetical protein